MSLQTLAIDAYQLTTLVAHAAAGRLDQTVSMAFFFRRLPADRNVVIACGLASCLEHAARMRLDDDELAALERHPTIGPAMARHPEVIERLRALNGFDGEIDALPEGTPAFAGDGLRTDGRPLTVDGVRVTLYTPLLQVRTDLTRAKLIETPWLSRLNHASMVASKAARIVAAAGDKPVFEFGQRRTHPEAALAATRAAWLAGCAGSSNVAAMIAYGVPASGTMDHFYVQAAEQPGVPVAESERAAFAEFHRVFGPAATMLVDTYDTERGLRHAVEACQGNLPGVRLDSHVTVESVKRARQILDELGARQAKILLSDQLDEYRVRELQPLADAFGVGENITCSPDAATGIGAVAKIVVNGYGKPTMKLSRGSRKMTLPGEVQVYRFGDHDLIGLADEEAPAGGRPLLQPVWRDGRALAQPSLAESRAYATAEWASLPSRLRALEPADSPWPLVASDRFAEYLQLHFREGAA